MIPLSWSEVSLGEVTGDCELVKPDASSEFFYLDIAALDRVTKSINSPQLLRGDRAPSRARKLVRAGDVLVSMVRPNLNAVALVPKEFDGHIASTGLEVLRARGVDPRWIFYLVRTDGFVQDMSERVQGALYPAVKGSDIREYRVPIAPLREQERVADKLEALLARVDGCRERLDRVPGILKRFRQSVLAAATSGELTSEWFEGSFMDFFDIEGGTQPPKSQFVSEARVGYVRLLQIRDFGAQPVPTFIPESRSLKRCKASDVLLGRYGASVGRVCTGLEGAYNVALAKVIPKITISPGYLQIFLSGPYFYQEINRFQRSAQDGFNKSDLASIPVRIPPLLEQERIVTQTRQWLEYIDRLEALVGNAKIRVGRLISALLDKAFRGELVPQDPNDEPAAALLERLRDAASPAKARRGRRSG